MSLFQKIFKPNNGTTFARSQYLGLDVFPTYLSLGTRYRVIESTDHGICFPGDPLYEYMIRDTGDRGPVLFVRSPFKLPTIFWVRGLTTKWHTQYEILPENDDGIPLQVQQIRQAERLLSDA